MPGVVIDVDRSRAAGRYLARLVTAVEPDPFTDERYYPPADADRETVAMYFLVMVAMDHRLSRPGRPYRAVIDGEAYEGADLLYRLGVEMLHANPEFFTAESLSKATKDDVIRWLSVPGQASPPDPDVRAELLRDIGVKLLRLYDGSAYTLLEESGFMLRRGVAEGFIDRLKVFKAYNDPVEKKAFLLAKFLERRRVARFLDPENKEVPVDNHLVRIALRLGMVKPSEDLMEAIRLRRTFTPWEDVFLRLAVRKAYRVAAEEGGVDPFIMDDFLWLFGRRCCTREAPVCRVGCRARCSAVHGCNGGCSLAPVCLAYTNDAFMVTEHMYLNTWWY